MRITLFSLTFAALFATASPAPAQAPALSPTPAETAAPSPTPKLTRAQKKAAKAQAAAASSAAATTPGAATPSPTPAKLTRAEKKAAKAQAAAAAAPAAQGTTVPAGEAAALPPAITPGGSVSAPIRPVGEKRTAPAVASGTPAPGGGPGLVWVNTKSHVYHVSTSRYYGKTKAGKYMTEQAAIAEGDKAAENKD